MTFTVQSKVENRKKYYREKKYLWTLSTQVRSIDMISIIVMPCSYVQRCVRFGQFWKGITIQEYIQFGLRNVWKFPQFSSSQRTFSDNKNDCPHILQWKTKSESYFPVATSTQNSPSKIFSFLNIWGGISIILMAGKCHPKNPLCSTDWIKFEMVKHLNQIMQSNIQLSLK